MVGVLDLISASPVAPWVVFGFLGLLVYVRLASRRLFKQAQKLGLHVAVAASQHFKNASSQIVGADWATYRWAATNWGYKGVFRSFRAVFNLKRSNDPLFGVLNYMQPSRATVALELKFKPSFEAYACVVRQKHAQAFVKQNQDVLARFNQVKCESSLQMCESFQGLASVLKTQLDSNFELLQTLSLQNGTLRAEFALPARAEQLSELTSLMFEIAAFLRSYQLSDAQQRQNQKKIEGALKFEQKQQVQKQVERDEEIVQAKIAEMNKQLLDESIPPAEKQKLQQKLEQYQQRERMRMSKAMAAQMGMAAPSGGQKGQRVVVMK